MRFKKAILWVLFCAVLVAVIPEFVHRRDFDIALSAWLKDPSPQNEATLAAERHKTELIILLDKTIIGCVLFLLGVAAYGVYRGVRWALHSRQHVDSSHFQS